VTERTQLLDVQYMGCWDEIGHYRFVQGGAKIYEPGAGGCPWPDRIADGTLQPGAYEHNGHWSYRGGFKNGDAVIHHKHGWTALSFWDNTVDSRPGSHSTFMAKGIYDFISMKSLCAMWFPEVWGRFQFPITEAVNA